jgi:RNA ligase (TIGR02306 family)
MQQERKLASIQKITALREIPNADNIECATILGWQVVVQKGEFKVGDFAIYCEIDSLIPDIEIFSFLKKMTNDTMRIRTVRMRGQVSQGICFPLSFLKNFTLTTDVYEGVDVTSILGIIKYEDEIPAELLGSAKGYMPADIPKSSILRVQTMQEVLNKYQGTLCYESEKLDGESITMYLKNSEFGVCSKVVDFFESEKSIHWQIARAINAEEKLKKLCDSKFRNFSMQGEMIGEGIKGNKYKIKGRKVMFYNIFNIDEHRYLNFEEFENTLKALGLESVPIINRNLPLPTDIEELVKLSNGRSLIYDTKREGVVITPLEEINDMVGRVIFKVISPEFLLKHGE